MTVDRSQVRAGRASTRAHVRITDRTRSEITDRTRSEVVSREIHERGLDAAKLQTPQPRRRTVARPRLLEHLRADPSPVVLVSAPSGYGKSILGSQWSHEDPRPAAWVHLDEDDDDPIRLAWYLLAALERLMPVPDELYAHLVHPAPRLKATVLPGLADLLRHGGPSLLTLDDVHLLRSKGSLEVLAALVDAIPDASRLMLLTRSTAAIALSQARLDGRLLEIGTDELMLTTTEVEEVARAAGWSVDRRAALDLRRRSEGWPAAVSLAAHATRNSTDGRADIADIAGDRDIIADYLAEVALSRLDDDRLRFLLSSSVLDWMSGPLCDTALRREGSADMLEGLARDNLFVVPLDARRQRYRYHHLFRDWLRAELERKMPGSATDVLRRAAAWHEARGDDAEAFEYARQAGDLELAGRVALKSWDHYANTGQLGSMRLWLARCTDAEIESDPQLSLAAAWVHLMSGAVPKGERYLAAVERGDLGGPSADGASSLGASLANARAITSPDGVTAMLRDGEAVIASESAPRSRWLLGGYRMVGQAELCLGRPLEARSAFVKALKLSEATGPAYVHTYCRGYMACACADEGDWTAATRFAQETRRLIDARGFEHIVQAIPGYVAMAMCLHHAGAATQAATELAEVERLVPSMEGIPWLAADMAIRSGEVSLGLGNRAQARAFVDIARESLARYPDAGTLPERLEQLEHRAEKVRVLSLTPAELRLVPWLPTHLSVREISERTGHSRATIKTQVAAIYAKLGVDGRSAAVKRLEGLGLLTSHSPAP